MDEEPKDQEIRDNLDSQITVNDTGTTILNAPRRNKEMHVLHRSAGHDGGKISIQAKPKSFEDEHGKIPFANPDHPWYIQFGNDADHGNFLLWDGQTVQLHFGSNGKTGQSYPNDDWMTDAEGALEKVDLIAGATQYHHVFSPGASWFRINLI